MTVRLSFFLVLLFCACNVQNRVRVADASVLHWAGGVYGLTGENYHLVIQSKNPQNLRLDSIYIAGHAFRFATDNSQGPAHYRSVEIEGKSAINAWVEISRQEERHPYSTDTGISQAPVYYPKFAGEALLKYTRNGISEVLIVPKFRVLPSVSYP